MTDLQKINHLYRRGGFGLSPDQFLAFRKRSFAYGQDLFFEQASRVHFLTQIEVNTFLAKSQDQRNKERDSFLGRNVEAMPDTRIEWMNLMGNPDVSGLHEKMTLFWHGHFATHIRFAHSAVLQNNHIRKFALGNFGDLLRGMVKDPALLNYLNNNLNTRQRVNENFGRELLELFTLGIGNYTQKDIVEASRAFTGWGHHEHYQFFIDPYFHDSDSKIFLGQKGNFDGDDIVDILLKQKQTARFIAGKLYCFFVSPIENTAHIEYLTEIFFKNNFEILPVLKAMFSASWFFESQVVGNHIKSPIELIASIMRVFRLRFKDGTALFRLCEWLDQQLFFPPNVAGWPNGEAWISAASLFKRLNVSTYMANQVLPPPSGVLRPLGPLGTDISGINLGVTGDFQPVYTSFEKLKGTKQLSSLVEYLLPVLPPSPLPFSTTGTSSRDKLLINIFGLMGTPEYQLK